jgi:hypothetical protein
MLKLISLGLLLIIPSKTDTVGRVLVCNLTGIAIELTAQIKGEVLKIGVSAGETKEPSRVLGLKEKPDSLSVSGFQNSVFELGLILFYPRCLDADIHQHISKSPKKDTLVKIRWNKDVKWDGAMRLIKEHPFVYEYEPTTPEKHPGYYY